MPLQGQENANQHGHGHDGRNFLEERHNIDIAVKEKLDPQYVNLATQPSGFRLPK
jgi:hypothetical protein